MSLRSERGDYPEIYNPKPPVLCDPSNKDKNNLQSDRFSEMSPEAFAQLAIQCDQNSSNTAGIVVRGGIQKK